jgi:hypothetical protein
MVIICSLHNVHEMNVYRAGHCLSVGLHDSTRDRWTDLDEIWYGHYATADYPKFILFNFLQLVIPTWQMIKLVRWDQH